MPEINEIDRSNINPYRLAELVADRPINWANVTDEDAIFQQLLGVPRAHLFSPRQGSPVFAGLEIRGQQLVRISRGAALAGLRLRGGALPVDDDLAKVHIPNVSNDWLRRLSVEARRRVVTALLPAPEGDQSGDWEPPDGVWMDVGQYLTDAIERTDPDQGAVGDCYFMAALASVALTHPTKIHRCSGAGPHVIKFHSPTLGGWKNYTVTEKIPVRSSSHTILYGKSTDVGEMWPAVYEKAYAQYRAGTTSDKPNYEKLSGGSGTKALHHLTGWGTDNWRCSSRTGAELYAKVREFCVGGKTIWPMVADTYGVDEATPSGASYSAAGIVANHVYSVFGWMYKDGVRYIVLRNPWGHAEATVDVLTGTWGGLTLNQGGLFALKAETFQKYFESLGVAKD